ncbi:MAG: pilus assembly protein PilC, partial [Acinetobacter junii]|nr:pilus assembly protein PilC [Acinetobacter junii]
TETVTLADLITKPELRQVGSVMHSTPILLTQSGKISYTSGTIDTTDRDDYLLFGSTQGLLHVVRAGKNATDANRGKEVFTFVPHEMMRDQKTAFLKEDSTTGGSANLFYGIDAPWTAYTQYVAKADGTLTVKDSGRVAQNASGDDIAIKGLQWVYGGLRMGGKSYYALNLSDLDNPELKFHIDPASSKIYKSSSTTTGVTALSYMGQSWSKPTIAYVKFGGVKKLVMFVGGGYDPGYENAAYNQTNGIGAGVYMFDANNGDLLWWTSANATAAGGAEAYTNASASTINMKYSVVSQINAIDRDSDGLVDNLYFGDLGGQGFRVDLNNAATGADASAKKANFAKRVVRLFDEHATGGASPRFYEMPSVSIHEDNGYVAAVAFSSGNRSSPLVGAVAASGRNNQAGSTVSAADGVFVVYDKDVAKTDLYASPTLTTQNISFSSLNTNISTGVPVTGNNGWKYIYSNIAGVYKGMNELYALDGMLYVNVFHRDGTGIGGSCGAGVKGDSYVYQFCLPTGKCPFN